MSILDTLKAGACGDNPALGAFDDALAAAQGAVDDAMSDVNGAIAGIESKIAEAQGALDSAIGDALAPARTLQGDIAAMISLGPLDIGLVAKIAEFKEYYATAVGDIDELLSTVTGLIENPLGAAAALCDLPNVVTNPDGTVGEKAKQAKVPAADAVIEVEVLQNPQIKTEIELRRENLGAATASAKSIIPPSAGVGGLSVDQSVSLQSALLQRESSGDYTAVNSIGYVGGYQFGAAALEDLGYIKAGTYAAGGGNKSVNDPANWTGKGGMTNLNTFLQDRATQDSAFQAYSTQNYNTLRRIGTIDDSTPPNEVSGLLAAAHLQGAGGARDYANGSDKEDAYGTKTSEYFALGSAAAATSSAEPYPDATPAATGSGSITIADVTSNPIIPYVPELPSRVHGLTLADINVNLQILVDEVLSPIYDEMPDMKITHGFRSEHVERVGGRFRPRRKVGGSHHYGGYAADLQFRGVTNREEFVARANRIRQIVPEWTQMILENPGSFDNQNLLLHIAYNKLDPRNQVLTALRAGGMENTTDREFV